MGELLGRNIRSGDTSETSRRYSVRATSETEAVGKTLDLIVADLGGLTLGGLALSNIDATETNVKDLYTAVAQFRLTGLSRQDDETRVGFDFSQETLRIKRSLNTIRGGSARPPNFGNAVGVVREGGKTRVEGIDVPAPSFSFTLTKIYPIENINDGFLADLGSVHLHTNATFFKGFQPGEVLLLGVTGQQRSNVDFECHFRFGRRPNERLIRIPGLSPVPLKRGWEYLEVFYDEQVDEGARTIVPVPLAWYVHQVFPIASYNFLGL